MPHDKGSDIRLVTSRASFYKLNPVGENFIVIGVCLKTLHYTIDHTHLLKM